MRAFVHKVQGTAALFFLFFLANLSYIRSQVTTPPWTLGDESTIACYTIPSEDQTPVSVNITGISLNYIKPLNTTIYAGVPIDASVGITVAKEFYTQNEFLTNNYTIIPDPNTSDFTQLCLQPLIAGSSCVTPVSAANCCVWHMNWHFCPNALVSSASCLPWVNTTTSIAGQPVLLTSSPAQFGLLNHVYSSDTFALPNVSSSDMYTILAHFRFLNIQCAIGANRRVIALPPRLTSIPIATPTSTDSPSPTLTSFSDASGNNSNNNNNNVIIAGTIGGCTVILTTAIIFAVWYLRRPKTTSPPPTSEAAAGYQNSQNFSRPKSTSTGDRSSQPLAGSRQSNFSDPSSPTYSDSEIPGRFSPYINPTETSQGHNSSLIPYPPESTSMAANADLAHKPHLQPGASTSLRPSWPVKTSLDTEGPQEQELYLH